MKEHRIEERAMELYEEYTSKSTVIPTTQFTSWEDIPYPIKDVFRAEALRDIENDMQEAEQGLPDEQP